MEHFEHLQWVLESPALLSAQHCPFALVRNPEPEELAQVLKPAQTGLGDFLQGNNSHFLGPYFESLWEFYLRHSPHYELIAANQQVHHEGVTLGELDYLVRDLRNNRILHQEIAVKFYLGHSQNDGTMRWIGPNAKDRLDLKLAHLQNKQLPFVQHEHCKRLLKERFGIEQVQSEVLLKGRLFWPIDASQQPTLKPDVHATLQAAPHISPQHLQGRWSHYQQMLMLLESSSANGDYWLHLEKTDWLSAELILKEKHPALMSTEQFRTLLCSPEQQLRARHYCQFEKRDKRYVETGRFFLVPSAWPG